MPFSRQASSTKVAASSGTSSARSRSGGARSGTTFEPEVEVLAELAGRDRRLQIAVGRGDDAHVDLQHLLAADARELARLQHAQHLGLRGQVHVADLVEEDRPAVGHLEQARACARSRR